MRKLIFEIIVHNAEYEYAYGILPFPSLIFNVLMLQKNILKEHEILKVPTAPLRIFNKLFKGKHTLDIQKKKGVLDDIPKQVATSAANINHELFFYPLN